MGNLAGTITAEPATLVEGILAGMLADVMKAEQVPVDSHFFDELGADSLVMAKFCARVRKRENLPSVSMKDIYAHPTIRSLAAAFADASPVVPAPAPSKDRAAAPARSREYVLCGTLQLVCFLGYVWVAVLVGAQAYEWISAGSGLADIYLRVVPVRRCGLSDLVCHAHPGEMGADRSVEAAADPHLEPGLRPVLDRQDARPIQSPGVPDRRFAAVRGLSAVTGCQGRAWRGGLFPACAGVHRLADDRRGHADPQGRVLPVLSGAGGWIQTGAVSIGRNVFIGEKSVLDIDTSMGDGSQLGHASALYSGQAVPADQRWHGSPAERTAVNYCRVPSVRCSRLRRAWFCTVTSLCVFFVYLPLIEGGAYLLVTAVPRLGRVLNPGSAAIMSPSLYTDALYLSLLFFFGLVLAGLLFGFTVPRVLNAFIEPDRVYPLYGFHDRLHRMIAQMTGIKFFTHLFGDSSYIVYYLRWLGYDLSRVPQTGSNFGTEVGHETPFLSTIGSGTMVADGLSIMNADFSATSFRVSRVSIGPNNFIGNNIAYPAGGRTGDNCLIATKAMIPLDGEIREGVGLLGSPPFQIPRSVERDSRFDHFRTRRELRRRLPAKNRHNLRTMGVFLLGRWLEVFLVTVFALAAFDAYGGFAQLEMAVLFAVSVLVTPVYFVLLERGIRRWRGLEPKYCSIYDPYFWRHERLWKVPGEGYLHMFDGTPFKNLIWRGLGVKMGKRVFDDGCYMTERTLTTIGDDVMLNASTKIQCHSQEDGTFKSDRSTIGSGCTIGVGAMVHYGVTMGEGSVLAPDSFLMKGEEIPPHARWGGNPAREM